MRTVEAAKRLYNQLARIEHTSEINFVRHAKTILNKNGIVQGGDNTVDQTIYPIELHVVIRTMVIKETEFDRIYSSNALRAKETAFLINQESSHQIIPELNEINWGIEVDGFKKADEYELLNKSWLEHKGLESLKCEGGESLEEFLDRMIISITKIVDDIVKYKFRSILIVGHGFFFGILFGLLYDGDISLKHKLGNLELRKISI